MADFATPILQAEPSIRALQGGRAGSLSSSIVTHVRDALFEKRLRPGEFLGTERDLAERFGVSRIVARDALRTLQALGIAEVRMGKGGGARIARGNPALFAEALAVQLELAGITAGEIVDAQRAIESLGAELAARHATPADHQRLERLLATSQASIRNPQAYTRACRDFHLAVAESSHNRVIAIELISLQHIPWPTENPTLTAKVARQVLEAHRELLALIERRDANGARALMNDHVGMIRSRRMAERSEGDAAARSGCC